MNSLNNCLPLPFQIGQLAALSKHARTMRVHFFGTFIPVQVLPDGSSMQSWTAWQSWTSVAVMDRMQSWTACRMQEAAPVPSLAWPVGP